MAVTKILAVRNRLDKRVAYVTNEQKTHLDASMTYITNPEKTEQSFFVSAINCNSAQTAFEEMMDTKRCFDKLDGVQAYHIIQSFAPGEVTPEQAHRIGLRLCERLFENRYEVVVGTHLDKAHLHNHILVNSVAQDNGAKYHSNRQSYYQQIRRISDELCREEQLSVIEPHSNGQPYAAWKNQKTGKLTLSQMLRDEIDLVIRDCVSFPDFLDLLEKKGYVVSRNANRKYLTVRPPGAKRNFRLDRLGQGYTVEDIKQRIQHQLVQRSRRYPVRPQTSHRRVSGSWQTARKKKITGFHALYLRYVYLLRKYKRPTRKRISYEMRREVLRLERYQAQFLYLHKQDITTMEQLEARLEQLEAEIQQRTDQRQPLYTERRQTTDEEVQKMLTDQIAEQTAALRALRKERSLCRQIKNQIPDVQKNLPEFEKKRTMTQKEVMQHEHQRRNR